MLHYLGLIFWCAVAALLTASFVGEDLTVSLRIWLAAFASWFAASQLFGVFSKATLVPSRFRLLAATVTEEHKGPQALHDFRSLESLLLRSRDNERTNRQQLQPRLAVLADHFLLVHHGINRAEQPEQAASVLGDVGWLIEGDPTSAAPTFDDIDRFLDRLMPNPESSQ